MSRLDQARRIGEEANDPDATVIIDSFHTWNSGGDIEELRELPAERISHFHIDDADPVMPAGTQADPNRVMPGDGPIVLEGEISILREIGYEGTVSLELFNPGLWEKDPAEVLAVGIERMRGLCCRSMEMKISSAGSLRETAIVEKWIFSGTLDRRTSSMSMGPSSGPDRS